MRIARRQTNLMLLRERAKHLVRLAVHAVFEFRQFVHELGQAAALAIAF
jgi:hypothetical protein